MCQAYCLRAQIYIDKNDPDEVIKTLKKGKFDLLKILNLDLFLSADIGKMAIRKKVLDYFVKNDSLFKKTMADSTDLHKDIYLLSLELMAILHVKDLKRNDNGKQLEPAVAHYTRKEIAGKLLFKEAIKEEEYIVEVDNKSLVKTEGEEVAKIKTRYVKKTSPMRLGSVATANDPHEGLTLLHSLGIEKSKHEQSDFGAFITCLTFNHESLNQFRLYGKDNDREATGVSLVIKKDYFEVNLNKGIVSTNRAFGDLENMLPQETEPSLQQDTKESKKLPLFRCVYMDPRTEKIVSVGHREPYTFYRETEQQWTSEEVDVYEKKIASIVDEFNIKFEELKEKIDDLNKKLKQQQDLRYKQETSNNIEVSEKNKKELEDKNRKRINKEQAKQDFIVAELLLNLRYLVKHVAFKEEQECRLITVANLSENKDIKVEDNARMFIEHLPINDHIHRVYFAPHTGGHKLFQDQIKREGLSCPCELTDSPFRKALD